MNLATLLAHQGGWDELLLVSGPVVIFAALLVLARRRANALVAEQRLTEPEDSDPPGSGHLN